MEGLSVLTKPLNDLTTPYKKSSSIMWTPQLEQLFKHIQEAVGNCPKLYYVSNDLPIHVRTDASDYGIGGYIFQKDGHTELPIRFISKSLHKSQLNHNREGSICDLLHGYQVRLLIERREVHH